MNIPDWPLPPIRPEDLPLIRGLLSLEDYRKLAETDGGRSGDLAPTGRSGSR